ncbi:MAG: tyrosine-type recombinase/integrase [Candidatus Acidiferrum sp.]
MALELTIYNRQTQTSKSGKAYIGYVVAFKPGHRGAIPSAAEQPPFYVRDQRGGQQWLRLQARTLADAKAEAEKMQHVLQAKAKGIEVVTAPDGNKERLTNKVATYLAEIESNKSKATWNAYRRSTELFLESCRKLNVAEVGRADMLAFKTYLKRQEFSGRSLYNHFLNITIFFVWARGEEDTLGLKEGDWPEKPERDPEAYTEDEIKKLLETAARTFRGLEQKKDEKKKDEQKDVKKDDRLLLWAFLNSGLRDGELLHLMYGDIDAKHSLWKVRPKDGHKLTTTGSKRDVPVGEWLTAKVMAQKKDEGKQDGDLIFPSARGGVDTHLIRITQRIAKLAGVKGRVDNHKFRATAITFWLRAGNTIFDVMAWAGHESSATVQRYAAKLQLENRENRRKATRAFDQYAGGGD